MQEEADDKQLSIHSYSGQNCAQVKLYCPLPPARAQLVVIIGGIVSSSAVAKPILGLSKVIYPVIRHFSAEHIAANLSLAPFLDALVPP